jgi:putative phosphoesterase
MMRFLVLSDIHSAQRNIEKIINAASSVQGIIIAGDLTQFGDYQDAEKIITLLTSLSNTILAVPGNMDRAGVVTILEEKKYSLHGKGIMLGGIGFFGAGGSNETPFHTPTELSENEITRLLVSGFNSVRAVKTKILISHTPPVNTALDRTRLGIHAGSTAVRQFIEKNEVAVCICGHIHEAFGEEVLGNTRCYNIGAVKDNHFAFLDVNNDRIEVERRKIN